MKLLSTDEDFRKSQKCFWHPKCNKEGRYCVCWWNSYEKTVWRVRRYFHWWTSSTKIQDKGCFKVTHHTNWGFKLATHKGSLLSAQHARFSPGSDMDGSWYPAVFFNWLGLGAERWPDALASLHRQATSTWRSTQDNSMWMQRRLQHE